jgi:DNA-binding MarR family transcriptional regulator
MLPMKAFTDANISEYQRSLYRGLIAHLMVVTHFAQKTTVDRLLEGERYSKSSLAYEGSIAALAGTDHSPGELAIKLGISKQACSKSIKALEAQGLVARRKNPGDSRSSLLSLTDDGRRLLQDRAEATAQIYQQFSAQVGAERMQQLIGVLEKVCRELDVELPSYPAPAPVKAAVRPTPLNVLLPTLDKHFRQTLFMSLSDLGFRGLRPSFGQVLGLISREGRRIQYIASVIGISKQAVAAIAADLERAAYITREPDPDDKRQIILRLSPLGAQLLSESVTSVRSLEATIAGMLSEAEYQLLDDTLASLYLQVAEHYDTANVLPAKIQQLSEYLLAELGVAGVRSLTQHLMTITRG